jgi:hypothetical protein
VGNPFRALQDLIVCHDIVKHNRRIVDDVTDDMGEPAPQSGGQLAL